GGFEAVTRSGPFAGNSRGRPRWLTLRSEDAPTKESRPRRDLRSLRVQPDETAQRTGGVSSGKPRLTDEGGNHEPETACLVGRAGRQEDGSALPPLPRRRAGSWTSQLLAEHGRSRFEFRALGAGTGAGCAQPGPRGWRRRR